MTPNELATFLREEVPRIRNRLVGDDESNLLSALDAAVRLIKRACYDLEDADFTPGDGSCLEDLRLVVGAVESHPSIQGR